MHDYGIHLILGIAIFGGLLGARVAYSARNNAKSFTQSAIFAQGALSFFYRTLFSEMFLLKELD